MIVTAGHGADFIKAEILESNRDHLFMTTGSVIDNWSELPQDTYNLNSLYTLVIT